MHHSYTAAFISATTYGLSIAALMIYACSIVYGRIYTAMHSFMDCAMGVFLGASCWAIHYFFSEIVDTWVATGGWIGESGPTKHF